MSHESPTIDDPCIYRVTHAACGWQVLTHDWQFLADDHLSDCRAETRDDLDYDFRINCTLHNPTDDHNRASMVEIDDPRD